MSVTITRTRVGWHPARWQSHPPGVYVSPMDRRSHYLTLPNLVSSSRFALAVGFVMVDTVPLRLAVVLVAAFTDVLDGWLARRGQGTTRFGALLDPIADRIFVVTVVLTFVLGGGLATWQAVALLFRDVMSVIGWFVARSVSWLRAIPFAARWPGKVVTALQFMVFLSVLLWPAAITPLVVLVFAVGLFATADYTRMLWRESGRRGSR